MSTSLDTSYMSIKSSCSAAIDIWSDHAKNEQCTTILLTKNMHQVNRQHDWQLRKAHSKAVIIIPLHSSAQWDWVSNKNIINWLNLYLLCQLNGDCIHQSHLRHHVYTILTDFSWSGFMAAAKQSSSSLCVQIYSPLSLLTPFTY